MLLVKAADGHPLLKGAEIQPIPEDHVKLLVTTYLELMNCESICSPVEGKTPPRSSTPSSLAADEDSFSRAVHVARSGGMNQDLEV